MTTKYTRQLTSIHTANQQQLHTRQLKTSNNTHETNYNFTTCTEGKNTQAKKQNFFASCWLITEINRLIIFFKKLSGIYFYNQTIYKRPAVT